MFTSLMVQENTKKRKNKICTIFTFTTTNLMKNTLEIPDFKLQLLPLSKKYKVVETKNAQKKKLALILADIKSASPEKINQSLDALQVYGDYTTIEPLFEVVLNSSNDSIKAKIIELLCNLKDSKSIVMVMDCLHQSKFDAIKIEILTTIWNSPLDYSEYLEDFVKIAVENDYLLTLECLTIIENLDGPFDEKSLFESQLLLKDYHEGKYERTKAKDQLISEIAILIKDFDRYTID